MQNDRTSIIKVEGLGVKYPLFNHPHELACEYLFGRFGYRFTKDFWALRDISFEIAKGDIFGIIGHNGSGKTTLLQVISSILEPSEGSVTVEGSVGTILELGSGFDMHSSARSNIFTYGLLLGLPKRLIREKFDDIVDFAEIEEFVDQPLKNFSTGMISRLAFAIFSLLQVDILIIDEAFSVGDVMFQQKCFQRIREMTEHGTTILLVSHDMHMIRTLCRHVMLLQHGRCSMIGESFQAIQRFFSSQYETHANAGNENVRLPLLENRIGGDQVFDAWHWINDDLECCKQADPAAITHILMCNAEHRMCNQFSIGQTMVVYFIIESFQDDLMPGFGLQINDRYNRLVNWSGSYLIKQGIPAMMKGGRQLVQVDIQLTIEPGDYTLKLVLGRNYRLQNKICMQHYECNPEVLPFEIVWDYSEQPPFYGSYQLPMEFACRPLLQEETL